MNKYNFTNQSNIDNNNRTDHSLVFRQEKKKKRKIILTKSQKNPDFKTWKQNEKNPLKRAVMIKKLKPHMVTGQFRNQSCQLSRVQLINRGVSRLHVWLRPQQPTMPLHNTKFRGAETLGVTFPCQSILAVHYEKWGPSGWETKKQAKIKTKLISPTSILRAEALTWLEPWLYQDKRPLGGAVTPVALCSRNNFQF